MRCDHKSYCLRPVVSFCDEELVTIMNKRKAHSRSALLHNKANPKREGYSTFDSGASTDYGRPSLSAEYETPQSSIITSIEDSKGSVSISWQNINVFVEIPEPSFFKRLCFCTNEGDASTKKQVLFNGKEFSVPNHAICGQCKMPIAACTPGTKRRCRLQIGRKKLWNYKDHRSLSCCHTIVFVHCLK